MRLIASLKRIISANFQHNIDGKYHRDIKKSMSTLTTIGTTGAFHISLSKLWSKNLPRSDLRCEKNVSTDFVHVKRGVLELGCCNLTLTEHTFLNVVIHLILIDGYSDAFSSVGIWT